MGKYNADYFIHGLETGKSLYSNYRWIPELTIPLAYKIIKALDIKEEDRILDYGCAMGYLVKAFRLLGHNAYGYDISEYALDNVPVDIQEYVYRGTKWDMRKWDWVICKDVLEHVPQNQLSGLLGVFKKCARAILVIVPLADNGKTYNEPLYEMDETHIIRGSLVWWTNEFHANFLHIEFAGYELNGIKNNWRKHEHSNGFFILKT